MLLWNKIEKVLKVLILFVWSNIKKNRKEIIIMHIHIHRISLRIKEISKYL